MHGRVVTSPRLAPPVGPFSPAVELDGMLYLSGQVAQDPATGKLISGDVAAQAEQVLDNVSALLHAAGKSLADAVRVTVYLITMDDFAALNAVYAQRFTAPYPVRTTVAVAALPLGARVEIEVTAR